MTEKVWSDFSQFLYVLFIWKISWWVFFHYTTDIFNTRGYKKWPFLTYIWEACNLTVFIYQVLFLLWCCHDFAPCKPIMTLHYWLPSPKWQVHCNSNPQYSHLHLVEQLTVIHPWKVLSSCLLCYQVLWWWQGIRLLKTANCLQTIIILVALPLVAQVFLSSLPVTWMIKVVPRLNNTSFNIILCPTNTSLNNWCTIMMYTFITLNFIFSMRNAKIKTFEH